MGQLEGKMVRLGDIVPAPRNPKSHADEGIDASIKRFGFVERVLINSVTGHLVAGHGRVEALVKMKRDGLEPPPGVSTDERDWLVPADFAEIPHGQEEPLALALNRLVEAGGWDNELLVEMLSEFSQQPDGLRGLGWDDADVAAMLAEALKAATPENPPDDAEPRFGEGASLQTKWGTALGQLWIVPSLTLPGASHRVLCGDACDPLAYQRLLGSTVVHIVWTDPPWNVNYGSDADHPSWRARTIQNDNLGDRFPDFCQQFMLAIKAYTQPGAALYLAMSGQEWPVIDKAIREAGFHWSSTIIWAKDSLVLSRKDYHTQYEPLWYGWLDGGARLHPLEDRTQSDLWQIDRPKRSEEFPIMKPIELVERALKNSSVMGEDVLDPFLGSGTTVIAAERLGRQAFGMELDPVTLGVVLQRLTDIGLHPTLEAAA